MLRFIALLVLFFLLLRAGLFLVRMLIGSPSGLGAQQKAESRKHQVRGSNLKVDRVPEESSRKSSKPPRSDKGDYVDYEEVKD